MKAIEEEAKEFLVKKYKIRDPEIYNSVIVHTEEKGIHTKGLNELLAEFAEAYHKMKIT